MPFAPLSYDGTRRSPSRAMSGGFRVLHLVRPFLSVLPEVRQADRKVPFREKALYTGVSLFVFLVCSQCVPARGCGPAAANGLGRHN